VVFLSLPRQMPGYYLHDCLLTNHFLFVSHPPIQHYTD
jgi:hypothetical protein